MKSIELVSNVVSVFRRCSLSASTCRACSSSAFTASATRPCVRNGRPRWRKSRPTRPARRTPKRRVILGTVRRSISTANLPIYSLTRRKLNSDSFSWFSLFNVRTFRSREGGWGPWTKFTAHYTWWRMPPLTRQRWGLPRKLAQYVNPGWGQLINVALRPLMGRVWMYAALPSCRMDSPAPLMDRPNRVTRESGRVSLMGMERGRSEYWVTLYLSYLYCLI